MVPTIYLKLPWEKKAFPVRLVPARHENSFYIRIEGEGRTALNLGGDTRALVPLYETLKAIIHEQIDYREGPIEASPPGMFQKKEPAPAVVVEEELPPSDPDGRHLTVGVLADKSTEEKLALMIEYFNAAPPGLHDPYLVTALMADYRTATGKPYRPRKKDEVGQAVAKLLPHRAELLDSEGKPKHGAKTQVARIMEFSQTGGGFARRIDNLLAALAEVHLEETRKAA